MNSVEAEAAAIAPLRKRLDVGAAAAAGVGDRDRAGVDAVVLQRHAREDVGDRAGRGRADDLALEILPALDVLAHVERVGEAGQGRADELDVGAVQDRLQHGAGRGFDGVDGAGQQRAHQFDVAGDLDEFHVDAVLAEKAFFLGHIEEAGVALERHDAFPPLDQGFGRCGLHSGRGRPERQQRNGQFRAKSLHGVPPFRCLLAPARSSAPRIRLQRP